MMEDTFEDTLPSLPSNMNDNEKREKEGAHGESRLARLPNMAAGKQEDMGSMEQIERLVQPPSNAETLAPVVDRHGRAQMAAMLEYIA